MPVVNAGEIELSYRAQRLGPAAADDHGHERHRPAVGASRSSRLCVTTSKRSSTTIAASARAAAWMGRSRSPSSLRTQSALLGALEIDSAHVLGISMGGMVAQELALAHPERIRTLALGCTYCGGEGSALAGEEVLRRLAEAMSSGDRARAIRASLGGRTSLRASPPMHDAYGRFVEIAQRRAVAVEVIMAQMQAIAGHDTSARLPSLAAADARHPRHARSDASGPERAHDRRADPRLPARDLRRRRPPVLLGAARAVGGTCARARRGACLTRQSCSSKPTTA